MFSSPLQLPIYHEGPVLYFILHFREYYGVAVPDFTSDYSYDDYDDYLGVDVGLGGLFARQVKKDDKDNLETEDFEFDYDDFEATDSIN